jgi:ParB family chromosome partitioning protein
VEIVEVPLDLLREAPWNPNEADEATLRRLGASMQRFGIVVPLVVRSMGDAYEVLSGNQRLKVLREQGAATAPCVQVEADDARARLLAQALNALHGQDDLNRKAALVQVLLAAMPADEVAAILPDGAEALRGLGSLAQQSPTSLGEQLAAWQRVQEAKAAARLAVTSFPLSPEQKEDVERAIRLMLPRLGRVEAPNRRGVALAAVCAEWADGRGYRPDRRRAVSPRRDTAPEE